MSTETGITVTLTPEIGLNRALTEAGVTKPASVTKLTVIGTCTKSDFKYMRDAMGKTLQKPDLGDAVLENNKIGKKTFYNPNILTSVIIPDTVDDIHLSAFHDCPELISIAARPTNPFYVSEDGVLFNKDKTVLQIFPPRKKSCHIPDTVTGIDTEPLHTPALSCITVHPDNPEYTAKDGVLFNKECTELLFYPRGKRGDYTISDTAVTVRKGAFKSSVSITLPGALADIEFVCRDTGWLDYITVYPDNPKYASEDGVLFNKNKTVLLFYPRRKYGSYTVPDTVIKIRENAFEFSSLTSVVIPDSVKVIGEYAFFCCDGLTSVAIPESVVAIEKYNFRGCFFTVHPDNPVFKSENGKLTEK